jgi:hypothetical protein
MKKLLIVLIAASVFLFTGCATVAHKHIETKWSGLGVDLEYRSVVAIPPEMIPEFIEAVTRLERLLDDIEQ